MGKVQTNFLKFHDNIKLDNFDENQALRDKRDMLITELECLKDEDLPDGSGKFSFETKNQGSYWGHERIRKISYVKDLFLTD